MIEQIHAKIESLMPDILKSIQRMVAIESVESEPLPDAPYGIGPKRALDEALAISAELGFTTKNIDNKIGYAQYGDGDGDYIGIFGHVDVVPLGKGWIHNPLGGEIDGERIYGRGVLDNKGPIITNLYALYAMKELGIKFKLPVRIVFGTNEETGFKCVQHYLTKEKPPVFGWTPDCKWPVVYGERGRGLIRIVNKGNRANFYQYLNDFILSSPNNGVKLGINVKDDDFGELIMRGYTMGIDDNGYDYFQMALSYPAVKGIVELGDIIASTMPEGIVYQLIHNWDPVLNDKHSKYIEPLTQSYAEVMGERLEPVTTTGGTYAKIIPNIIAYGPSFPGENGIAHLPDEWMNLEDIAMNAKIYGSALFHLAEIL
ncbi:Sapep family Mn(2+)-dependent dipeptidase [Erysipelothrix sp. HDW6C]|uniref:Sapep family Mn(2+)-dependent dipeptidase n=1 Tax=Erysipelothrix sp. HDW6C TaxID=2714930 RepID=UPI001F10362A|nr:Sapep family Mn(2+)-dependent dipeptidase [Erysipelothrix sp. HDW6C]